MTKSSALCCPANPRKMPRPTDPRGPRKRSSQGPKPAGLSVPGANWCRTKLGQGKRSPACLSGEGLGAKEGAGPFLRPRPPFVTFPRMSPLAVLHSPGLGPIFPFLLRERFTRSTLTRMLFLKLTASAQGAPTPPPGPGAQPSEWR